MKLHFFGKKSMSLKRFYRYVLITILLVILCFVLTAVCLTFISQKNKILTHTHSVLANIAEEYQGIEKNFWTLYMPIFENRDTYQKVYDYFSNQTDFEHSPINRKELHGVLHLMTNRDYRIAWIAFYSPLREENYVYVTSEDSLLKLDGESPIWNDLKSKNRPIELYGAKIASDIGLTFPTFSVGGGLPSEMGSGAILVGYPCSIFDQYAQASLVKSQTRYVITNKSRYIYDSLGFYSDSPSNVQNRGLRSMLCAHTYARLILLSFILYCALAALTVTVNSFIPSLFTTSQAFFMSFFHLVNYGGIALSKTTAGLLIRHNVNWRFIYLIIAAILIICLGLWHFSFFPAPVVPDTEKKPERTLPLKHIFSTAFFLYVAAVGGYLSSVTAMHNWFVNYAVISFHMNIAKASSVFSLFFIFSALGSVFLARFIKRVGEFKIVFLLSFAAFFLFLLGLLWRQTGLYLIALCGFFLSVTYPTTLVNIHTSFHLRPCFMLGLIVTAGSAINLIFTFVLGIANDVFGAHASFYLVPLGLLVFSVSSFFIYLRQNTSLSEN